MQQSKANIMKKYIHKNIKRVDYYYKVNDKVIINNKYAYKYKTLYMGPYKTKKLGPKVWAH